MTTDVAAGPELDALVAEKVMGGPRENPGWYWFRNTNDDLPDIPVPGQEPLFAGPKFSTDWGAAGEVLERVRPDYPIDIAVGAHGFVVRIAAPHRGLIGVFTAETGPEAICRAALAAVEASGD